jgi:hypothetical protein
MSDLNEGNKVLGLAPSQYVKIAYILVVISSGVGVLLSLLAMANIFLPIGALTNLLGFIGLLMAVIGWAAFKDKFAMLEISHLQYIVLLFVLFLLIGLLVGALLLAVPTMLYLMSLLLGIVQFVLIFTGFNSWSHGRTVTKQNVQNEVKAALKRA